MWFDSLFNGHSRLFVFLWVVLPHLHLLVFEVDKGIWLDEQFCWFDMRLVIVMEDLDIGCGEFSTVVKLWIELVAVDIVSGEKFSGV